MHCREMLSFLREPLLNTKVKYKHQIIIAKVTHKLLSVKKI